MEMKSRQKLNNVGLEEMAGNMEKTVEITYEGR